MIPPHAFFCAEPRRTRRLYDIPPVIVATPRLPRLRGLVANALYAAGLRERRSREVQAAPVHDKA